MTTPSGPANPLPQRDERLAALLAGLVEQSREGKVPDVEAVARVNPDLAVELRELWAVAGMADDLALCDGAGSDDPTIVPWSPHAGGDAASVAVSGEFGGFELLEKIGEGGMGVVYK